MKNLVFGLIATVLFSSLSFGQKVSSENQKDLINSQMVAIVNGAKVFYTKGQSYEGFLEAMLIPSPTVPTQDEFFKKVYQYVSKGTSDCEILESDNSVLKSYVLDLSENPKSHGSSSDIYAGKKWWQNLIEVVLNVALDVFVPTNTINIVIWDPKP